MNQAIVDWFTPLMTIIGVILGASLTPFITSIIEKNRIKLSLKPQIIKSIYLFFNIRKAVLEASNMSALAQRGVHLANESLRANIQTSPARLELERQHVTLTESLSTNLNLSNSYFKNLVDIEAELHSLLSEIHTYYGKRNYIKLKPLLEPHINESNNSPLLHDYNSLNWDEYNILTQKLRKEIMDKSILLQEKCDAVIMEVSKLF